MLPTVKWKYIVHTILESTNHKALPGINLINQIHHFGEFSDARIVMSDEFDWLESRTHQILCSENRSREARITIGINYSGKIER